MSTAQPYALITGSTRGIGYAIAVELAGQGFKPILNYRSDSCAADRARQQIAALGIDALAIQADVTTEAGARALVESAASHGPIDILVNNVGEFIFKPFLETDVADWHRVLASNLMSTVLCCQLTLPLMRRRNQGQIINIASMHAGETRARPNTLPYAIAKSGVIHLTQTLAKTEGPFGIRVNAICPGFIDGGDHTQPKHADRVPLGRLGQPEDIAQAIRFLVSDDANYITGATLNIHGGALL